jgi:hypothetical protein
MIAENDHTALVNAAAVQWEKLTALWQRLEELKREKAQLGLELLNTTELDRTPILARRREITDELSALPELIGEEARRYALADLRRLASEAVIARARYAGIWELYEARGEKITALRRQIAHKQMITASHAPVVGPWPMLQTAEREARHSAYHTERDRVTSEVLELSAEIDRLAPRGGRDTLEHELQRARVAVQTLRTAARIYGYADEDWELPGGWPAHAHAYGERAAREAGALIGAG